MFWKKPSIGVKIGIEKIRTMETDSREIHNIKDNFNMSALRVFNASFRSIVTYEVFLSVS